MTLPNPLSALVALPAREGWSFIGVALLAAVLSTLVLGWGLVSGLCWVILALVVRFFHHVPRAIPADPGAILSPADGRIVKIEKVRDHYANRDALRISVFLNVFNAHANRSSVDGVVRQVQFLPEGSSHTERNALVIESGGQLVTMVQVARRLARRVLCHAKPGDTLTRGQRYGLIRFGSRVDVYLPPHAVLKVAQGQRVSATTTILATLPKA